MFVIASVKLPVNVSDLTELLVHDPHSYSSGDDAFSEWQSMHLLNLFILKRPATNTLGLKKYPSFVSFAR